MSPPGKDSASKSNGVPNINDLDLIDKPLQVDKWDGCAVKNALDDTVKKIMIDTYGYAESHALMDGRLIICTVACLFALFAMVSYFAMMVVLTFYTTYFEQGIFLEAVDIDPTGVDPTNKWILSSGMSRFDDVYTLEMVFVDGKSGATRTADVAKSVAGYVDENGLICEDIFTAEVNRLHSELLMPAKKDQ